MQFHYLSFFILASIAFADGNVLQLAVPGVAKPAADHAGAPAGRKPRPTAPDTERAPYVGTAGSSDKKVEYECVGEGPNRVCRPILKGTSAVTGGLLSMADLVEKKSGGLLTDIKQPATSVPLPTNAQGAGVPLFGEVLGETIPPTKQRQNATVGVEAKTLIQKAKASGLRFSNLEWEQLYNLQADQAAGLVNVVSLGAPKWCGPCRTFEPTFQQVSREFSGKPVRFNKIDTDDSPNIAKFLGVSDIPAVRALSGNGIAKKWVGVQNAENFHADISSLFQE